MIDKKALNKARAELADSLRYLDSAIAYENMRDISTGCKAVHVDADELYKIGTGRDLHETYRKYAELRHAAGRLLSAMASGKADPEAERIVRAHTHSATSNSK